jgi:vacuolar protein sorting-associated protein 54
MAVRKHNLEAVIHALSTIETLHKTQPTIQLLLSRQEFAGALDLIATSKDILNNETANVVSLKHLPSQPDELMDLIEKMLLSDFQTMVNKELEKV